MIKRCASHTFIFSCASVWPIRCNEETRRVWCAQKWKSHPKVVHFSFPFQLSLVRSSLSTSPTTGRWSGPAGISKETHKRKHFNSFMSIILHNYFYSFRVIVSTPTTSVMVFLLFNLPLPSLAGWTQGWTYLSKYCQKFCLGHEETPDMKGGWSLHFFRGKRTKTSTALNQDVQI